MGISREKGPRQQKKRKNLCAKTAFAISCNEISSACLSPFYTCKGKALPFPYPSGWLADGSVFGGQGVPSSKFLFKAIKNSTTLPKMGPSEKSVGPFPPWATEVRKRKVIRWTVSLVGCGGVVYPQGHILEFRPGGGRKKRHKRGGSTRLNEILATFAGGMFMISHLPNAPFHSFYCFFFLLSSIPIFPATCSDTFLLHLSAARAGMNRQRIVPGLGTGDEDKVRDM